MLDRFRTVFAVIHKDSLNEAQKKRSLLLATAGTVITLLFLIYNFLNMYSTIKRFWPKCVFVGLIIIFAVTLVITICRKDLILPSVIFNLAFLVVAVFGFVYSFHNQFSALYMFVVPTFTMYIFYFAISFWTGVAYFVLVVLITYMPHTRAFLLQSYSPLYLSRYYIIYGMVFCVSAVAMLQLHVLQYNQGRKRERLEEAVKAEREKVSSISMQTIIAINNAVQAKDLYTGMHSQRVAHFSCLIAEKLKWSEDAIKDLRTIALLHDIGKIGVDEEILNKPSLLTEEEYSQMKQHTVMGGNILQGLTIIPNVELGATSHHERFDGNGYPDGLSGEDIPIEARIICIADTFDAMNFSRVYRSQCELDYVKSELIKGKGSQFDPKLIDVFIEVCEENDWFRNFKIENETM